MELPWNGKLIGKINTTLSNTSLILTGNICSWQKRYSLNCFTFTDGTFCLRNYSIEAIASEKAANGAGTIAKFISLPWYWDILSEETNQVEQLTLQPAVTTFVSNVNLDQNRNKSFYSVSVGEVEIFQLDPLNYRP